MRSWLPGRDYFKRKALDYTEALSLLMLSMAVIVVWPTIFVYPFKLLVVFFHELSHALMAWATGGRVVELALRHDLSGHCVVVGGNAVLIASAGYLGSILWGIGLLLLVKRSERAPYMSFTLGMVLLSITVLFLRPLFSFGFIFSVLSAIGFLLLGWKAAPWINRVLLQCLGITSCLKALLDIYTVSTSGTSLPSDAVVLAQHTGIPAIVWGVFWMLLSLGILWWSLPYLLRRPAPAQALPESGDSARFL